MSSKRVMNKQENRLLIKVICEMMPYGIIVHRKSDNRDLEFMYTDPMENMDHFVHCFDSQSKLDDMELYLRPMSSMTDEEYNDLCMYCSWVWHNDSENLTKIRGDYKCYDWLDAHHFDYRGLIEKGLALEAPKGMYE